MTSTAWRYLYSVVQRQTFLKAGVVISIETFDNSLRTIMKISFKMSIRFIYCEKFQKILLSYHYTYSYRPRPPLIYDTDRIGHKIMGQITYYVLTSYSIWISKTSEALRGICHYRLLFTEYYARMVNLVLIYCILKETVNCNKLAWKYCLLYLTATIIIYNFYYSTTNIIRFLMYFLDYTIETITFAHQATNRTPKYLYYCLLWRLLFLPQ